MEEKTIYQREKEILSASAKRARAGETWKINDSLTRGHNSLITKVEKDKVRHIPRTHAPKTRGRKNIPLKENPQKTDKRQAYILPKVQKSNAKSLGRKQVNQDIKNPVDKSIVRHIKKQDKKSKK